MLAFKHGLLLDQDVCQSHYAGNQSPGKDNRRGDQACPQGEANFHYFQPLSQLAVKLNASFCNARIMKLQLIKA